jgi:hypothetical protein
LPVAAPGGQSTIRMIILYLIVRSPAALTRVWLL